MVPKKLSMAFWVGYFTVQFYIQFTHHLQENTPAMVDYSLLYALEASHMKCKNSSLRSTELWLHISVKTL